METEAIRERWGRGRCLRSDMIVKDGRRNKIYRPASG